MIGRCKVVTRLINLNFSAKFNRVFALVGLVSLSKKAAHNVPISEIPAAKKKGACALSAENEPPTSGPITNPNANAEPKIPKRLALLSAVAVSATMAWATDTLPPVSPSRIRAANKSHNALASAKSRKDMHVPARLTTSNGLRPHLSDNEPKIGVAKNCAMENEAVNTPKVAPGKPESFSIGIKHRHNDAKAQRIDDTYKN